MDEAILHDILKYGLDPKKPYSKTNRKGELIERLVVEKKQVEPEKIVEVVADAIEEECQKIVAQETVEQVEEVVVVEEKKPEEIVVEVKKVGRKKKKSAHLDSL